MAQIRPDAIAVVEPLKYDSHGNRLYRHMTFRELDYDSDIINNPIKLLQAIRILMHDPARAKYPFASLTEAIMRLFFMENSTGI